MSESALPRRGRAPQATIIAFDDLVADTAPAKALAVADALSAECAPMSTDAALSYLPGRSLDEAVEAALAGHAARAGMPFDATMRDLAVLRARRSYSAAVAQGLPLRERALPWIRTSAGTHGRIVLRADSARRDVEMLLELSGLAEFVALLRCADDPPRAMGLVTLESSWRAIVARLTAQHVALSECVVLEHHAVCAERVPADFGDVRTISSLDLADE